MPDPLDERPQGSGDEHRHDGRSRRAGRGRRRSVLDETPNLDADGVPVDQPRGVLRKILSGVVSYGFVVAIFAFLLPKLMGSGDAGSTLALITPAQVAVMCVLGLANLATNLPPIVITLPGLRAREAGVTNVSCAAVSNTVPEGGAVATGLSFAIYRSWGFALGAITSSFLTTGIWTNLVRYGLMAVALLVLVATEPAPGGLWVVAIVIAALVAVGLGVLIGVLQSAPFARRLGVIVGRVTAPLYRVARKPAVTDWDERTEAFRTELLVLVESRWRSLTLSMTISQLATCLVLGVAVRMQGLGPDQISASRVIVAYGAMALASLVAPTPGGLGVAEFMLIGVLGAGLPGEYDDAVAASVLLFRLATWLLPIPIGAGCYLFWRHNHTWRMSEDDRDEHTAAMLGSS